jgi:hypothetical protein
VRAISVRRTVDDRTKEDLEFVDDLFSNVSTSHEPPSVRAQATRFEGVVEK